MRLQLHDATEIRAKDNPAIVGTTTALLWLHQLPTEPDLGDVAGTPEHGETG
ncbi:MAG TPA: hypothetical protein VER37_04670 [Thermomicrobiales bacterium]|nr:hypothetical protein [Thermomicrobiales bacterium]